MFGKSYVFFMTNVLDLFSEYWMIHKNLLSSFGGPGCLLINNANWACSTQFFLEKIRFQPSHLECFFQNRVEPAQLWFLTWGIACKISVTSLHIRDQLNSKKMWEKVGFGGMSVWTLADWKWRAAAAGLAARPGGCRNSLTGVAVS